MSNEARKSLAELEAEHPDFVRRIRPFLVQEALEAQIAPALLSAAEPFINAVMTDYATVIPGREIISPRDESALGFEFIKALAQARLEVRASTDGPLTD